MSDKITLLNMDCMDYMRGLPDKAFDLASDLLLEDCLCQL